MRMRSEVKWGIEEKLINLWNLLTAFVSNNKLILKATSQTTCNFAWLGLLWTLNLTLIELLGLVSLFVSCICVYMYVWGWWVSLKVINKQSAPPREVGKLLMRCTLTRSLPDRWAWARGFFRDCEGRQNCGNQTISGLKLGSHVRWRPWDWLSWILTPWLADRGKADTWAQLTPNTQSSIFEEAELAVCQQFRKSMCYLQTNKDGWAQYGYTDNINILDQEVFILDTL